MNLKKLHEEFIAQANRKMTFGALPVTVSKSETPVIPANRWKTVDGTLYKTYSFRRDGDRDKFVLALFGYENDVKHNAVIVINGNDVSLELTTHDVNRVTELDREYASYCDVVYKEVVYSPDHDKQDD